MNMDVQVSADTRESVGSPGDGISRHCVLSLVGARSFGRVASAPNHQAIPSVPPMPIYCNVFSKLQCSKLIKLAV